MRTPLSDLLSLSYVNRWAITPMFRGQTVAEHSFRVTVIAQRICELTESDWAEVTLWSLSHDGAEAYTGDMPKPFKDVVGELLLEIEDKLCPWVGAIRKRMSIRSLRIVHLADTIEAVVWVIQHGNGATWKFGPNPDQPLYTVLMQRLREDAKHADMSDVIELVLKEALDGKGEFSQGIGGK